MMKKVAVEAFEEKGAIDRLNSGFHEGWVSAKKTRGENSFCIYIDNKLQGKWNADLYRADLDGLDVENGRCGYKVQINSSAFDGKEHYVSLRGAQSKKTIFTRKFVLSEPSNMVMLKEAVLYSRVKKVKADKVAIFVGFTNSGFKKYHEIIVRELQDNGYYVITVIATDSTDIKSLENIDSDALLVRKNLGYDFGSWGTALGMLREFIGVAKKVVFINDSIVGPLNSMQKVLAAFEKSKGDFWGVTDSFEHNYHIQSYFFGIGEKLAQSSCIDEFFIYQGMVNGKDEVIQKYEVNASRFFSRLGFRCEVLISYRELVKKYLENARLRFGKAISDGVNSQLYLANDQLCTQNQTAFLTNTLSHLENGIPLNPSHFFWAEIIGFGFPFIKKELLFKNPINNPSLIFNYGLFSDKKIAELIQDIIEEGEYSRMPMFVS